jgi:hypothetical protein
MTDEAMRDRLIAMNWVYLVTTEDRPRVQSRILQVFDKQLISVESFVSAKLGDRVHMRVAGDTGACDGRRLEALLLHLEEVRSIRAFGGDTEKADALSVFHAACPRPEQAHLLAVLSAIGVTVTLVTPSHVTFCSAACALESEDFCENLGLRWPVSRCQGECEKCA